MNQAPILFVVPDGFYTKDPTTSALGKKILEEGLNLMHEIGLEAFTFKKLAKLIGTTESSIYRYFENKNQLLFYLFTYYWIWMEHQLDYCIINVESPEQKLRNAIRLLTQTASPDQRVPYINELKLQEVIMLESSKTFLSKKVDEENSQGHFQQYKKFVRELGAIIQELNPEYPWTHTLVSTVIESSFHQRFFARHLPRLTDQHGSDEELAGFFYHLCITAVKNYSA